MSEEENSREYRLDNRDHQAIYATKPTWWTRHLRVNILWQMYRFAALNLKMLRIIFKGHH